MRKPMMAGNWKMNKGIDDGVALATAIGDAVAQYNNVDRVVCPPFVLLPAVAAALAGSPVAVGAQNVHFAESGAYTGEVSVGMLKGLVSHVIIGHSERRQFFAETDEGVNKKTKALLAAGLTPIVCCGESLAQNQAGETQSFVGGQVKAALTGLSAEEVAKLVIAYEPIWAIGTGLAATAE
ncbi:MAG: triose-phosphate isomerase, partial [Caldilineaceae bacterium]